jgi:gamma-glutamylcyclotransferase (GGCT)/AIG2-like uncharacterized protein YtfP
MSHANQMAYLLSRDLLGILNGLTLPGKIGWNTRSNFMSRNESPTGLALFVYGTLRKDCNHPIRRLLKQQAVFIGNAIFQGKVFDLGRYPGAIASKRSSDVVKGEVYELHGNGVLSRLDAYEGKIFRRVVAEIVLSDGKKVQAWIYLYVGATRGFRRIASGDYVASRKSRRAS